MGFSKIGKESEKIHTYSDQLTNQVWLKKSYVNSFSLNNFFPLIC